MLAAVRKGDLYHPSFGNNDAQVLMGNGFSVVRVGGIINTLVPPVGLDDLVWLTPAAPFTIEEAFLLLVGNCTASTDPGVVTVKLTVNGWDLIGGTMTAWNGTNYAVDAGTQNRTMWGLRSTQGDKLVGGLMMDFPGSGTGDRGAMGGYGGFAALTDGGANGFWNKPVRFNVRHGGGNVTMSIPYRAILIGRLL